MKLQVCRLSTAGKTAAHHESYCPDNHIQALVHLERFCLALTAAAATTNTIHYPQSRFRSLYKILKV